MDAADQDALIWLRRQLACGAAKATRIYADLSLAEAGAPDAIDPSSIHRWERGERLPRGPKAIAYAKTLQRIMGAQR